MKMLIALVVIGIIGGIMLWHRRAPTILPAYGTRDLSNKTIILKSADGYSKEIESQLPLKVTIKRQIAGLDRTDYFIGQTERPVLFNNTSYSLVILTEMLAPIPEGLVVALAFVPQDYGNELKNATTLNFNKLSVVIPNCIIEVLS